MIETPGHYYDHLCFFLETKGQPSVLFTGDHILGSDTTTYVDYSAYMDSLYKLREMPGIDKICVAHSHDLKLESLLIDAKTKIQHTIDVRLHKDKRMLE